MSNKNVSNIKDYNTRPWTVKQLNTMNGNGIIQFDSYIQRSYSWDKKKRSLFIRSIITGFPKIPAMYANRILSTGVYQLLDGRQRIETSLRFINDEFDLTDDVGIVKDREGNEEDISGKKFSELSEDLQDIIRSYPFTITNYEDLTDDEIAELFFLLNNGKSLSPVEQDRALCKVLDDIQEIVKHPLFDKLFTETQKKQYKNEDFAIKSYIMLFRDDACLDRKYTQKVWKHIRITEEEREKMTRVFDYTCRVLDECDKFQDKLFLGKVKKQTHILSLLPLFESEDDIMTVAKWLKSVFETEDKAQTTTIEYYNDYCKSGVGHAASVKARVKALKDNYTEFCYNVGK